MPLDCKLKDIFHGDGEEYMIEGFNLPISKLHE